MSRRTITVYSRDHYDTIRLSLGTPHYGSVGANLTRSNEIGTGVFARALWIGRKHVVLLTYSQWQTRDGSCTGDTYRLCDVDDAPMVERQFGDVAAEQLLDLLRVPVAETISAQVAP